MREKAVRISGLKQESGNWVLLYISTSLNLQGPLGFSNLEISLVTASAHPF